jgi:UDP-N-acetylglucosamine:LPS N-acetylglucosamine transferase
MINKLKICAGASAGGHTNQLLRLLGYSEAWSAQPSFYITTAPELKGVFGNEERTYMLGECNRKHPFIAFAVIFRSLKILFIERPDLIITTGSMPIAIFCVISKLFGTKVVWIDSIANTKKLSMSGYFMRFFADVFLSQWEEVSKKYKGVEYAGELI